MVGLNERGVAKYRNFGPVEGYSSETVHDMRYVSINHYVVVIRSRIWLAIVPKLVTLE